MTKSEGWLWRTPTAPHAKAALANALQAATRHMEILSTIEGPPNQVMSPEHQRMVMDAANAFMSMAQAMDGFYSAVGPMVAQSDEVYARSVLLLFAFSSGVMQIKNDGWQTFLQIVLDD